MNDFLEVLEHLYKKVLLGATLGNDSQDYLFYLHPAFSDQAGSPAGSLECSNPLGAQAPPQPTPARLSAVSVAPVCLKSSSRETALLQLTVIEVMVARILSVGTEHHAKEKYREIIKTLLKSSDFESKLIRMFQNSDKLLSHLAAKCLALLLYFQLKEKMTLSNSWIAFCHKSLSEYSESDNVIYCLWTLSVVLKEIFKDTCSQKAEILKQFLAPFDTIFEVFYNSLFSQHVGNLQVTSKLVNSLVCSLELLELLTASRIHLELYFTCQRVVFLKPSCVLDVMTWPVQAFVKRKFIIFIKKCLLWKVGEDLCRGAVPAFLPADRHLDGDLWALASAVLQAVDLGFLRTLSVDAKPSCFGGGEVLPGWECLPGPDHVVLRAASLLVVKSLEIKLQHCAAAKEMKVDLQRFMSELLIFLKPHLQPSVQLRDPCEWLSRVFMEQDDDMVEAARALLAIYLQFTREHEAAESLTQENETWVHHTHENGYNPHCVFLFFVKNIGFDSTVLLDFLISSETCFLEYFVRYLKLLHKDWDRFSTICKYFDVLEPEDSVRACGCTSSLVQDGSTDRTEPSPRPARACVSRAADAVEPPARVSVPQETHATRQAHSPPSSHASQSLVEYDTSDDSEVESAEPSSANHQEAMKNTQDSVGTSGDEKELHLELQSRPMIPKASSTPLSVDRDVAPDNTACEVGMAYRTVKCFDELQGAIYRLRRKNLFPYNPSALLKLLKQIEAICNTSLNPL